MVFDTGLTVLSNKIVLGMLAALYINLSMVFWIFNHWLGRRFLAHNHVCCCV